MSYQESKSNECNNKQSKSLLLVGTLIFSLILTAGIIYASSHDNMIVRKINGIYYVYKVSDVYTDSSINNKIAKTENEIIELNTKKDFYTYDYLSQCLSFCPNDCDNDWQLKKFQTRTDCIVQCPAWCSAERDNNLFLTNQQIDSKNNEKNELDKIKSTKEEK